MKKEIFTEKIKKAYLKQRKSVSEIAKEHACSENKVNYWLEKSDVKKRTISEAIYLKNNPNGDPFKFKPPETLEDAELYGMGIGLFWGEGTKACKTALRLGNSDPKLILIFIKFLVKFFQIEKKDLRFHLHLFTDIDIQKSLNYWSRELRVKKSQFYKPYVTISGKLGNYRKKSKYGVVTLYYCNKKLRDIIVDKLPL